jgi:hypothetical protein
VKPQVKDGHYLDLDIVTQDGEPRNVFHLRHFHMIDARSLFFIEPDGPQGQARVKSVQERELPPPVLRIAPKTTEPPPPRKN